MSDPISWYALGREIGNVQTILEAIDAQILAHNFDASAHGQSDEAVYNHRISQLLDHVNYSVYNIKMHPETRPIKAFVDSGGAAEFSSLQPAIDYVNSLGGGKIFIKTGTYLQNSNITLYSNITIEGEDNDSTIIDFGGGAYGFVLEGTAGSHKRNVHLLNFGITNSIKSSVGVIYYLYVDDISIKECKFTNLITGVPIKLNVIDLRYVTRGVIERNYASIVDYFLYVEQTTKIDMIFNHLVSVYSGAFRSLTGIKTLIMGNYIDGTEDIAISLDACHAAQVINNDINVLSNDGIAVGLNDHSHYVIVSGNKIQGAVDAVTAIYIALGSAYGNISNNTIIGNFIDGIICANYDQSSITGNSVNFCKRGLYILSGSDRLAVTGNQLYGNTTNFINYGTNIEQGHNIIA